jgi:hypothetical protein
VWVDGYRDSDVSVTQSSHFTSSRTNLVVLIIFTSMDVQLCGTVCDDWSVNKGMLRVSEPKGVNNRGCKPDIPMYVLLTMSTDAVVRMIMIIVVIVLNLPCLLLTDIVRRAWTQYSCVRFRLFLPCLHFVMLRDKALN